MHEICNPGVVFAFQRAKYAGLESKITITGNDF